MSMKDLLPRYIIKECISESEKIRFYKVFVHYPTTEPDVYVMNFFHKENAELFCAAMNAENRDVPAHKLFCYEPPTPGGAIVPAGNERLKKVN